MRFVSESSQFPGDVSVGPVEEGFKEDAGRALRTNAVSSCALGQVRFKGAAVVIEANKAIVAIDVNLKRPSEPHRPGPDHKEEDLLCMDRSCTRPIAAQRQKASAPEFYSESPVLNLKVFGKEVSRDSVALKALGQNGVIGPIEQGNRGDLFRVSSKHLTHQLLTLGRVKL